MTQTATVPNPYLPVEAVFDTTDPGWLSPDETATFLTPGHIDVTTFNTRIYPIADVPLRIDPETIRHAWIQFSRHNDDCLLWSTTHTELCAAVRGVGLCDSSGATVCDVTLDADPDLCGCARFTGITSLDRRDAVHLIDATADAPGAVAVTWAEPAWDKWNAEFDRVAQARRQPIEVTV